MDLKWRKGRLSPGVPRWYMPGMSVVCLLSLFLNFFLLGQNGYGIPYYAAGVRSMLMSWHNFFFVSFDPNGFVSIDKPPLAFWLQAGSARLFGFSPWSLMMPQALAGVLSVLLLAHLVRRTFGPGAALLAALTLAITPISVVTNRSLNMDSQLIFVLLLATWTMSLAVETGRLRFLLLSALLVGIGFNIKMLEAYLILPALALFYWFSVPFSRTRRLLFLSLAAVVLLVVSFCWISIVDLVPAAQRPFVGSSGGNSELQLALFYNGIARYLGRGYLKIFLEPGQFLRQALPLSRQLEVDEARLPAFVLDPGNGNPGLLRLAIPPLGEQIGWLLPLAIIGVVAGSIGSQSLTRPLTRQQQGLIFWIIWFLTDLAVFSAATFMFPYYTAQIAPALAALLGIGIVFLARPGTEYPWRRWLLPLAIVVTLVVQLVLLSAYLPSWGWWLIATLLLITGAGVVLFRFRVYPFWRVGLCLLFIAPAVWTAIPVITDSTVSLAGPTPAVPRLETLIVQGNIPEATLIHYLLVHQGKTRYLAVTLDSTVAAPLILATGKAVMALGGYNGADSIVNLAQVQQFIATDAVRYFVVPQNLQEMQLHVNSQVMTIEKDYAAYEAVLAEESVTGYSLFIVNWVRQHCAEVPENAWHASSAGMTLLDVYQCTGGKNVPAYRK